MSSCRRPVRCSVENFWSEEEHTDAFYVKSKLGRSGKSSAISTSTFHVPLDAIPYYCSLYHFKQMMKINWKIILRTMPSIGRRGSRYWKQGNAPRMTTCTYTKIGTLLEPPNTCTLKNWVKKSPWKLGQKGWRRKGRTGLKPFSQQPLLQFFYPVLRP